MSRLWLCTYVTLILTLNISVQASSKKLEKVSDDEFLKLVQTEKYVVALFSKFNSMNGC